MLGHELRHLKHVHDILTTEDRLECLIGIDVALILGVLEILAFDIDPELLHNFGTGHRTSTNYCCEFGTDLHRLHERGIARRHKIHFRGYGNYYTPFLGKAM